MRDRDVVPAAVDGEEPWGGEKRAIPLCDGTERVGKVGRDDRKKGAPGRKKKDDGHDEGKVFMFYACRDASLRVLRND